MPDVEFVRFNDVADLRSKFSHDVCAVLVEAIQGEGGIRPLTQEFLSTARELTQESGALLVIDEIQAGFGRTGKWFAYQHYGVLPDITNLAKPLAGGLPLGAMLCNRGGLTRHASGHAWHYLWWRAACLRGCHRCLRHH